MQTLERTALAPRLQNLLNCADPHILHRCQTVANRGFAARGFFDGEVDPTRVDIRRKHIEFHAPAVSDVERHSLGDVLEDGEQRGHVLDRVVGFQVGCLHGDHAVIGRMRLVEAVAGEILPVVEDLGCHILIDAALGRPVHELRPVLAQHACLLLGDRLPQLIGFRGLIAGKLHGSEHDLLLIDRNAVGFLEDRLELRMLV